MAETQSICRVASSLLREMDSKTQFLLHTASLRSGKGFFKGSAVYIG